jgi:uncharacterized repeat protein (TIGR03803 family)
MKLRGNATTMIALALFLIGAGVVYAQESILHSFSEIGIVNYTPIYSPGGYPPTPGLILDAKGNLYGTTSFGGYADGGTVYEVTQGAPGSWTETVLHSFYGYGGAGYGPEGRSPAAGLTFDSQGNLYGTTASGGAYGQGTVFELSPAAGWAETVLFSFDGNGTGGVGPYNGVIVDAKGNLYGAAVAGGANGGGTIFELSPEASGSWTVKELYSFPGSAAGATAEGETPNAGLIFDTKGNLYGTTFSGGANGGGLVFKLTPAAEGSWTETVLHSFAPDNNEDYTDGTLPSGSLTLDAQGNLYGTTYTGGMDLGGIVFELSPGAGGIWTEQVLYTFNTNYDFMDGFLPSGGVVMDVAGNLYGTTSAGGEGGDGFNGTVFKLTPAGNGTWTEKLLHQFAITEADGAVPEGGMIFDAEGNLYGTTSGGGGSGQGTVFKMAYTATTVATPEFSPGAGNYTSTQMVIISDATPGATIYYTTNGYEPNASSTKYTGPITVSASELVKVIAYNSVNAQSATATAAYTVR